MITDEVVRIARKAFGEEHGGFRVCPSKMRSALEAVETMLRGNDVPESKPFAGHDTTDAARRQNAEARGWNACRAYMLAAAPKPDNEGE